MSQNLLAALTEGGNVRSVGTVTLVVLGRGRGAFITTAFEYSSARKWAEGRAATGVDYRDMNLFMERFTTYIVRSGSALTTKGHPVNLVGLAKEIKTAGFELSEWSLPDEVKDELKPKRPVEPQPKKDDIEEDKEDE